MCSWIVCKVELGVVLPRKYVASSRNVICETIDLLKVAQNVIVLYFVSKVPVPDP